MQGRGCFSPLLELGVPTTTCSSGCRRGDVQHLRHRCSTLPKPASSPQQHCTSIFAGAHLFQQELAPASAAEAQWGLHHVPCPAPQHLASLHLCVCVGVPLV